MAQSFAPLRESVLAYLHAENEPESSLHPDLLAPLGRLIANTAERSQVFVITHSPELSDVLEEHGDCNSVRLEKEFGETKIVDAGALDLPVWRWASR